VPASPNLIADAVVTAIRGLGLIDAESVVKRKTPSLPPGKDPPCIVVVVGEGGEEGETEVLTAVHKLNRYPTTVLIITAAGGKALADDETVREWRVAIEQEVGDSRTCWDSVPGWVFTKTIGKAPFDGSVLPKDLNYSAQTFIPMVVETRGG
jgi:hypothetical protein